MLQAYSSAALAVADELCQAAGRLNASEPGSEQVGSLGESADLQQAASHASSLEVQAVALQQGCIQAAADGSSLSELQGRPTAARAGPAPSSRQWRLLSPDEVQDQIGQAWGQQNYTAVVQAFDQHELSQVRLLSLLDRAGCAIS